MAIRTAVIELDKQGLVLIKGDNQDNPNFSSNGAGKSSIIESLVYVLFGRTIRGTKGDDIVNRVAKSNCKVTLDITDDDGTKYRITRYRKHKEHKNNTYLFCNGTDISPKSEADFTKTVIGLLQTDFLTFTSSILYSAESFKFTQATDSELKQAFDVMLDLKVYSDCLDETKEELREISSKRQNLDARKGKLDTKKEVLLESKEKAEKLSESYEDEKSEKIEDLNDEIVELEEEQQSIDVDLAEIKNQMSELSSEIDVLKAQRKKSSKTDEALKQLRESIDEAEEEKSKTKTKMRRVKQDISSCEDSIEELEQVIEKSEASIKENDKKLLELQETVGTPCPVCGKPLDEDHITDAVEELQNQIGEFQNKIEDSQDAIDSKKNEIKELQKTLEDIQESLDEIEEELENYQELLKKVQERQKKEHKIDDDILDKERQYTKIERQHNSKSSSKDTLQSQIELLKKQIQDVKSEENPYKTQVKDYQKQIQDMTESYSELDAEYDILSSDEEVLNFWLTGFSNSGIKSMLLDDITPFLNKRANKYLQALSGDRLSVNFTTQTQLKSGEMREKFQIEVNNEDGGDSYMANSSGEKKRVDIAINLALQDLVSSRANKKINMIFLDEALDALDNCGVDDVLNLLSEVAKDKSSVFVISHNENIQTAFENFLVVTKKNGYSTVVKE